ncbi:nuclear transport factor 2 family protein [Pseudonocardia xishanensis]|uniref:SnoaL-like domain-containing protein n=1 Tax=Pseudonocardia xishanensis TaxID=630995 RepID=A0ABP8RQE7_9PSEU
MTDTSCREVVDAFYAAIAGKDAEAVTSVVTEHFADDVVLDLPASLPYGGRIEGVRRLVKIFAHAAGSTAAVGVQDLQLASLLGDGPQVAAHLTFTWFPAGAGASFGSSVLELWTFDAGRVISIEAFYQDTAALVAVAPS